MLNVHYTMLIVVGIQATQRISERALRVRKMTYNAVASINVN